MKIKKDLTLSESTIDFVSQYKIEHGSRYFSSAIDEIILDYQKHQNGFTDELTKKILEEVKKEYDPIINKIRFSAKTADFNSQVIIELLNTIIISMQLEQTYLTTDVTSNALLNAIQSITDRIAYYNELKENNKHKKKRF